MQESNKDPIALHEVCHAFYKSRESGCELLNNIKKQHPEISWYPFQTQVKVELLSLLTDYFDENQVDCIGSQPSVLDVGTADGDLAFLFEMAGCHVSAIDNAPSNFNDCKGFLAMREFLQSSVEFESVDIDYDFTLSAQYDVIIFLDILYHLRNPMGVLINLCRAGEYMFVSTRICDEAKGVELTAVPAAYLLAPFEAAENDPTNYWIFTESGFMRVLDRCGWTVRKKVQFGYSRDDSNPYDAGKDKRIICLCQRKPGYDGLKHGHYLP